MGATDGVHVGGRVEIVVPIGVNAHTVRDFVQRFTPWIDRKVAAMQCFAAPSEPVPGTVEFALTDEKFAVDWRRGSTRGLKQSADLIEVHASDERGARELLQGWPAIAA